MWPPAWLPSSYMAKTSHVLPTCGGQSLRRGHGSHFPKPSVPSQHNPEDVVPIDSPLPIDASTRPEEIPPTPLLDQHVKGKSLSILPPTKGLSVLEPRKIDRWETQQLILLYLSNEGYPFQSLC